MLTTCKISSLCNLGVYHTVSLSIVTTLCLGVPELPHLLAGNLYNDQHLPISPSSFCPTVFLEIWLFLIPRKCYCIYHIPVCVQVYVCGSHISVTHSSVNRHSVVFVSWLLWRMLQWSWGCTCAFEMPIPFPWDTCPQEGPLVQKGVALLTFPPYCFPYSSIFLHTVFHTGSNDVWTKCFDELLSECFRSNSPKEPSEGL